MTKTFEAGQHIFEEGSIGAEAYLIRSGRAAVWREQDGEKVHLAVKCEGEIIGEMSLLDNAECSASVTAETQVEVDVITREDMEKMLAEAPETLSLVVHQLMESLRTSNDLLLMYSSRIAG